MPLGVSQLFEYVSTAKRILLAGAGGGCDVYCGIPLYLALREQGASVHLANLSFANLSLSTKIFPSLYEVRANDDGRDYSPERYLAQWLHSREIDMPVYGFSRVGAKPIIDAYRFLVEYLELDAIILVDGGTDSLMRGDEFHLATPEEDITSIIAASETNVDRKALVCTAFGVDAFHGICHAHFLENVAYFMKNGGYLGTFSMDPDMPEVKAYLDAVRYLCDCQPHHHSIVNTSTASAIEGFYGDYHRSHRTAGSRLWINPLMTLCWTFELDAVAKRIMYQRDIAKTESYVELSATIETFRAKNHEKRREFMDIPV